MGVALAWVFVTAPRAWAFSGIDPTNKYAWAGNAGWVDAAASSTNGLTLRFDGTRGCLSGHAWGENIGWIKVGTDAGGPYLNDSATNWGVNMDADGHFSGYAWGENIGWIVFNPAQGGVTLDLMTGTFEGHAWGENIGWIKFKGEAPAFGVRTTATDRQPLGTPNWWLEHFDVTEAFDEGDGVPAWREYVADTDPTEARSVFQIVGVSNRAPIRVTFASSARRYYTFQRRDNLSTGQWANVAGQINVPGTGGLDRLQDSSVGTQRFYRVTVSVSP